MSAPGFALDAADRAGRDRADAGDALPPDVQALIKTRSKARDERDWPAADAARSALADLGWDVSDGPDGPVLTPRTD